LNLEKTIEMIRELLEPDKTIVLTDNDTFEIETMQWDSLGYCMFILHGTLFIKI
jgi:hypothetical protein